MEPTTTETTCLVIVTAFTGLLWMPYILNRLVVGKGLLHEVGYPGEATRLSPWADRLKRAHANAVENLVVYAPLSLTVSFAGAESPTTAMAAQVFLGARVLHAAAYTFAIPWVRTVTFSAGWACQMAVAYALLTR